VPSNYWRADEVIGVVATRAERVARELREAYREICGTEYLPGQDE
jgi:hypothetical protein